MAEQYQKQVAAFFSLLSYSSLGEIPEAYLSFFYVEAVVQLFTEIERNPIIAVA